MTSPVADRNSGTAGGDPFAREILQGVLDRINLAFFSNDADTFVALMQTPHRSATLDGVTVIRSPDEARHMFERFREYLAHQEVTAYVRVCLGARFVADEVIEGLHESHVLSGRAYVQPRFTVRTMMRRIDGEWRLTETDTHIASDTPLPRTLFRDRDGNP